MQTCTIARGSTSSPSELSLTHILHISHPFHAVLPSQTLHPFPLVHACACEMLELNPTLASGGMQKCYKRDRESECVLVGMVC